MVSPYQRATAILDKHGEAILLLLMAALVIALIFAVLGWNKATDAQKRVTTVEAQQEAERLGKNVADVTTCFNAAKRRPGLIVILRGIAVELEPDPRQALNELIDAYGKDTPTTADCVVLARKRGIDPAPYINNPPSEAGKEPR
jgi:hypothetical protein